jgi:hypothetical protein
LAASVRARLKRHADATKQDFNLTLTHYGLERLLYRLSISEHASNFLLKGALLFTLWYGIALQVDIGFGDAVTPEPQAITYPVLLEDFPAPQLRAYPKYTVVAEKFHAVCLLGMTNTRMKDYFDLWVLLEDKALDASEMRRAITATFERRKMGMPTIVPVGLSDIFAIDTVKKLQWKAFLNKNRLDEIELKEVVNELREKFRAAGVI